jgi:hypothetical protein
MKGDSHDPISIVESLFDTVPMMHIDVQVKHPRIDFEELQNANHYIVDVAEATGLCLFSVVVSPCPIDGHIRNARYDDVRSIDAPSCC